MPALDTLTLTAGELEATFVPDAGMVGSSLRHRGEELLGQRGGLAAYVAERKTMGIPLLHPWANRLARRRFVLAGREVAIDPEATPVRLDANGLPMHGLLSAVRGWNVERHSAVELSATFDFAAHEALLAAFPFPHTLAFEANLTAATLTIALTVTATGDVPVPIAFGFHPYLRLPEVDRADWVVEIPVTERLRLGPDMLPSGEREPVRVEPGPLGSRTFDDAYVAPADGAPFALEGGGRRIELAFEAGYPYAQVFAPPEDALIAFEPMTAPANALVSGGAQLPLVEHYAAAFSITVK
jgi:aldose 1-epimerase